MKKGDVLEKDIVFTPYKIKGLELKNRIVRSATYENAATEDGEVTDDLVAMYRKLGQGGAGLIITGLATVMPEYHFPHRAMRIDDDRFIPGLSGIAKSVQELENGCKIMLQLNLPGRQLLTEADGPKAMAYLPPALLKIMMEAVPEDGTPETEPSEPANPVPSPVAPSALKDHFFDRIPRELTADEIKRIATAYAEGALRTKKAGFDGVQIHAAHGWLLSSFLSPHTNQRKDQYGGSTENRLRIISEIMEQARVLVGEHFPILIKINTTDFIPDGTDVSEAINVCRLLEKMGFDAIELSGGMWEALVRGKEELGFHPYLLPESRTGINRKSQEAYFYTAASEIRKHVSLPLILVGGMKSINKCKEVLASGNVDFVSMSRALIRQPDLPRLWETGMSETADCISCNACVVGGDEMTNCRQVAHQPQS